MISKDALTELINTNREFQEIHTPQSTMWWYFEGKIDAYETIRSSTD